MKKETSFKIMVAFVLLLILNIIWLGATELGYLISKILLSFAVVFFFINVFTKENRI